MAGRRDPFAKLEQDTQSASLCLASFGEDLRNMLFQKTRLDIENENTETIMPNKHEVRR